MSCLLHLSDTHFGTERPNVVEALLRLADRLSPELAIVSGDITQRARRAEFSAAAAFFDRLPMPSLLLPGNHDIPLFNLGARLFNPYGLYTRLLQRELSPTIESSDCLVIGVNTTRPWRHTDGEVSARQIHQVRERLLAAKPGQLRIVVTHQPIHVIRKRDETNRLHGYAAALRAWNAAGADLLLGGHIHLPYVRNLREAYPDLPRSSWVVQAGTAVSTRLRSQTSNSVNLIRCAGSAAAGLNCELERWDFDDAAGEFLRAGHWQLSIYREAA